MRALGSGPIRVAQSTWVPLTLYPDDGPRATAPGSSRGSRPDGPRDSGRVVMSAGQVPMMPMRPRAAQHTQQSKIELLTARQASRIARFTRFSISGILKWL